MKPLCIAAAAAVSLLATTAMADRLTPETGKLLAAMKLPASIMDGLDKELAVPPGWVEAAKAEGLVKIRTTLNDAEFAKLWPVFAARYPFLKLEYKHGIGRDRAIAPLLAFKKGDVLSDVLFAFDSNEQDFREANALADISDIPGWDNVPADVRAPDGIWIGAHGPHYCLSYNPKTVKAGELPKSWDELVTSPRWRDGKIGMGTNVNTWITPLAGVYGMGWAEDYMKRLFAQAKPQLRKENLSMTPRLNAMGEYDLSVPAGDYAVWPYEQKGESVSFHCPDVVPKGNSSFAVMRGTPRLNAAKLFVNWAVSREGQVALAYAGQILPQHKALQIRELMPYPKEVIGRTIAPVSVKTLALNPPIAQKFHDLWLNAGGG
jgi:ABC-type Fe3+ transport system substrate-binding protein